MNSVDPKSLAWWLPSNSMVYFVAAVFAVLLLIPVGNVFGGQHEVQVEFSFDINAVPDKQIAGYRLYMESQEVCNTGPVDPQNITCIVNADDGTYEFTLAALYDDGTLSPQSAPVPFTIVTEVPPEPVVASAGADPLQGVAPFTVSFSADGSTGPITSYSWAFGDNEEGSGYTTSHTYTVPGTYTATLTVARQDGTTDQDSLSITVNQPPPAPVAAITLTTDNSGQAPFTAAFDGSSSTGTIDSYSWSFGDGNEASGQTASNRYTSPGTYTATLTVTGAGTTDQDTVIITVSEPPPPPEAAITLTSGSSGQAPFTVAFDGSDSTGTIDDYTWSFGNGSGGSGQSVSYTYQDAGTYTATLTVSGAGTTDQVTVIITVSEPPPPPEAAITLTSGSSGQAPFTVAFDGSDSTGTIDSYTWLFGTGETATGQTASYIYESAGTYIAELIVAGAGATSVAEVSITVTAPPVAPTAVITAENAAGEAPLTVTFSGEGSTTEQPPIVSCNWNYGDKQGGAGDIVTHTYEIPGTYDVVLTVTDQAGLTGTASIPVVVTTPPEEENQPPVATFTISEPTGSGPYVISFDASLSEDPDGSITAYNWDFGDGVTTDEISGEHSFTDVGEYLVSLSVTDNRGDTTESSQTIAITGEEAATFNFELAEILIDSEWTTVSFAAPLSDPVVIVGPPSFSDDDPATVRIRNLNQNGFEISIQEWDYLDGNHAAETVSFLAVEKGTYTLENGVKLEAGTFEATKSFKAVTLNQIYDTIPVILTQVATDSDPSAVTGRVRNTNQSSFEYKLQEQETTSKSHQPETVGYIAWEQSIGNLGDLQYEIGTTGKTVKHKWYTHSFMEAAPDTPLFIAGMQTCTGGNTASVRVMEITNNAVQVKVEEEQSKDSEVRHTKENIGYLSIIGITSSGQ